MVGNQAVSRTEIEKQNRLLLTEKTRTWMGTWDFLQGRDIAGRDIAGRDIAGRDIACRDIAG